jgi:hypothetical protein
MVECQYCKKTFTNRFNKSRHIHNSCKKLPIIRCNFKIDTDNVKICPIDYPKIDYYFRKVYLDRNNIRLRNKREKTIDIYINCWIKLNKKQSIKILNRIGQEIEDVLMFYHSNSIDKKLEKILDNKRLYRNKLIKLMTN